MTTDEQVAVATAVATQKAKEPFGWSRGTVRALVVLLLVVTTVALAGAVVAAAILKGRIEFLEQLALLVVGAVLTLTNLAAGFYFSQRQQPQEGEPPE